MNIDFIFQDLMLKVNDKSLTKKTKEKLIPYLIEYAIANEKYEEIKNVQNIIKKRKK